MLVEEIKLKLAFLSISNKKGSSDRHYSLIMIFIIFLDTSKYFLIFGNIYDYFLILHNNS